MNIESEKKKIIEWISEIEDESTIEELKILRDVSVNGSDLWDNLSEEEKKGIDEGIKDIDEGRIVSYEDVKKEVKKWLTKSNFQKEQ
ncbi:MAG: hypothetical protein KBF96_06270 [Ignavibacteria bacterium]|nr:hypothetical protein [Ignavibacteria bacterium]